MNTTYNYTEFFWWVLSKLMMSYSYNEYRNEFHSSESYS